MSRLAFAFSGPVLWAVSTHLDKYLVKKVCSRLQTGSTSNTQPF